MMKNMQHTLCSYIITLVREIEEGVLTITFQRNTFNRISTEL